MNANKHLKMFVGITLAVLFLSACSGAPSEPTSTPPPPPAPATTAVIEGPPGDIQPLSPAECNDIASSLARTVGIGVETSEVPFEDRLSGKTGTGCMVAVVGTGHDFTDETWPNTTTALERLFPAAGWQVDDRYRADGPAGFIAGYRLEDQLCLLYVNREPADMSLCPEDEPIFVCWADLTPEQKIHTITINCAHGDFAALEPQPSDIQPLNPADCEILASTLEQTVGIGVATSKEPFEDHLSGKTGTGCMASAMGTGHDFADETWPDTTNALEGMLPAAGWQVDDRYRADGPSGFITGYRLGDQLCLLSVGREPVDMSLCPEGKAIYECWPVLTPEQKIHTITLNCAQDDFAAYEPHPEPEPEPVRIEFAPGAISDQVQGSLSPGGGARYVLAAAAGQKMYVYLTFPFEPDPREPPAILIIWGEDGTVLMTDHVDSMTFEGGELPFTQDYFINVRSRSQDTIDFTLEVIIPAL